MRNIAYKKVRGSQMTVSYLIKNYIFYRHSTAYKKQGTPD
jgi:hypothetical protein